VASFSGLTLQKVGSYTLTVSAAGLQSATSASFNVNPGNASVLNFELNPSTTTAGQTLPDLRVDVFDAFGNLTTTSAALTLTINGPAAPTAGNTTAQATSGVATFHGLMLTKAGSYTLSVSAAGLSTAKTAGFTVTPAAASQLAFAPLPVGGMAGQVLPNITVNVLDPFGNLTASLTPVTLSANGAPLATTEPTAGIATFSGLVLTQAGNYTFTASGNGLTSATAPSATITPAPVSTVTATPVTAASLAIPSTSSSSSSSTSSTSSSAPAQLQLQTVPTTGLAGKTLAAVRLRVLNASGRAVRAGTRVILKLVSGHHSTTVQGKTNAQGIVTFTGLKLTQTGHYTLQVSTPGLSTTVTRHLTILPA
jgi:hypothetical protein